ncbi:armadillo repeat protein [Pestalotiopsis sp. NC0098]|nr:armadillo repeat protein [Pestalotiopsis sp. NC0098]
MVVEILSKLAPYNDVEVRLNALRALKNDVVGHPERKQQWVHEGALRPLVAILDDRTSDYKVKLSALQLLASFASAGSSFVYPIYKSDALTAVLNCLQDNRLQIVLAALRVIRDVADGCALAPPFCAFGEPFLADILFGGPHLDSFATILAQPDTSRLVASQVTIVARLISTLCREEKHQYALVTNSILDALATSLASFAVAEGQVIPYAEAIARSEGLLEFMPAAARSDSSHLSDILGAISAIVTDSAFRSARLLYSPSILAVFPNTDSDLGISKSELPLAGLRPTRQKEYEPMDLLLPVVPSPVIPGQMRQPSPQSRFGRSAFDSNLGDRDVRAFNAYVGDEENEEPESPLIPWLISVVRAQTGNEALTAASVLTSLFKCGFAYKSREAVIGLLVIPKLLQLLSTATENLYQSYPDSSQWDIIEQCPTILARLITDSESLQKAASDSNAIKTLVKLLKSTYDVPVPATTPFWSPDDLTPPLADAADSRLGKAGIHPRIAHRIRVRISTLKALGAIASFKEEYRTAIVGQDAVSYVVKSLETTTAGQQLRADSDEGDESEQLGNSNDVIIAACYTTRMLSRSVNTLRTTLVDAGVAMPIYNLLDWPSIDVQIAATAAICNLVTDFSPMRETLIRESLGNGEVLNSLVVKLCNHTKSQNAALRLNALWALKHLVHSVATGLKKATLRELGSGWLIQLICDDTEDEALFTSRSRDKQSSADLDEEMDMADEPARPSFPQATDNHRIFRLAEARVAALWEKELNPIRKARQDDLAIQEQGLGFIRNLIGSSHSSSNADSTNDTADMIDHLFDTLGQDRFFNILATKLRPKVLHAFSGRRGSSGNDTRVLYPQAKIIEAVVYILVHMAASIPRHRQLVIAQTEILKLLANLFNNQHREVRVALCHLLNNLTWQDDANDAPACSQRALELKKLGFVHKLETLGHDDELDVRERAKSALWQLKHG